MACYGEPPDGEYEVVSEWVDDNGVCCVCGREMVGYYDDREDCPTCGSFQCELRMQRALDYHEEAGDR